MLRGMDLVLSTESFQALGEVTAEVWFRKILLPELRETRDGDVPQECVMGVWTSSVWTSVRRDGQKGVEGGRIRNKGDTQEVSAGQAVGLWERGVGDGG